MKLISALAALTLVAAPAMADTYTHNGFYGDFHCQTTTRVYGKHSSTNSNCTTPAQRASQARAKAAFNARVKQQEAKMNISCKDYAQTAGQMNAADDGFTGRVPQVYVDGALLHCQSRVQAGQAPDGISYVKSATQAAKEAPGCSDASVGAATKQLMGC